MDVIGFAHRGMRHLAPDNSIAGYQLALAAGARALEGDVWPSSDGRAVLDHDGVRGGPLRRRPVVDLARDEVPDLDTLAELYSACGSDFELSLDIKHEGALQPVLSAAADAGALERLWLCHPDWRVVASWKAQAGPARLVDSTRLKKIEEGVPERLDRLADAGISALNMPYPDWSSELVGQCRTRGILALAWHAHTPELLEAMVELGVDGVFSDDVESMVRILGRAAG
jgi:glycerophosphoryl diester phosphodiesterase